MCCTTYCRLICKVLLNFRPGSSRFRFLCSLTETSQVTALHVLCIVHCTVCCVFWVSLILFGVWIWFGYMCSVCCTFYCVYCIVFSIKFSVFLRIILYTVLYRYYCTVHCDIDSVQFTVKFVHFFVWMSCSLGIRCSPLKALLILISILYPR